MKPYHRIMGTVALGLCCAFAGAVHAQPAGRSAPQLVAAAKQEFTQLRYPEAVKLLEEAWRRGESGRDELVVIFALAARASQSTNDHAVAQLWFRRWLCIEPAAALPPGTSPKLVAALDTARTSLAGGSIVARAIRRSDSIDVQIDKDPLSMIDAVRLGSTRVAPAGGRAALPAHIGTPELLDPHGNVLAALTVEADAPRVDVLEQPPTAPRRRWIPWAVVGGGFALVGAAVAIHTVASYNPEPDDDVDDLLDKQDSKRRGWWTAGISLGAAAVATTISVVFYMRDQPQRVSVAPTTGGAVATWSWQF